MIVDAEVKETNKTTRGSERRSVLEIGPKLDRNRPRSDAFGLCIRPSAIDRVVCNQIRTDICHANHLTSRRRSLTSLWATLSRIRALSGRAQSKITE